MSEISPYRFHLSDGELEELAFRLDHARRPDVTLDAAGSTGVRRHARVMAELMRRLGYERYLVQGGDWGSVIAPEIARVAPHRVIGVHLNAAVGAATVDWASDDPTAGLTSEEVARLQAPDLLVADIRAFCQNLRGDDGGLQTGPR